MNAYSESGTIEIPMEDIKIIPLNAYGVKTQANSLAEVSAEAATRSSGAWYDAGVGPTISHKGIWYTLQLSPSITIPMGATITLVSWSWDVNGYDPGLVVAFGNPTSGYYNVTSYQTGTTTVFNGINANTSFYFYFGVAGTYGQALNPAIYGSQNTITVSWSTD